MNAYIQMLTEYDVVVKILEATLILLVKVPILWEENITIYIPMFLRVLLKQLLVKSILQDDAAHFNVEIILVLIGSTGFVMT